MIKIERYSRKSFDVQKQLLSIHKRRCASSISWNLIVFIIFTVFFVFLLHFSVVILSMSFPEAEGRRLVLRGRRTITRHYYSNIPYKLLLSFIFCINVFFIELHTGPPFLPAWVVIVLVALGEILFGVILFFVLRKFILVKTEETMNTYQPAPIEDISNN